MKLKYAYSRGSFQMIPEAKKTQCPKIFFMFFRDKWFDKKGTFQLLSYLSGKRRYLTLKLEHISMAKNVVTYSRPLIDKLSCQSHQLMLVPCIH